MNIQLDSFILGKPLLYALDAALCALEAVIKRVLPKFHLKLIFELCQWFCKMQTKDVKMLVHIKNYFCRVSLF